MDLAAGRLEQLALATGQQHIPASDEQLDPGAALEGSLAATDVGLPLHIWEIVIDHTDSIADVWALTSLCRQVLIEGCGSTWSVSRFC